MTFGQLATEGALQFGDGYRTRRDELASTGFTIIRVADVADGRVSLAGPDHVSEDRRRQIGVKRAEPGDVLLTTKGTVGRVAVMPPAAGDFVYSPQLCWFRVAPHGPLDAGYLRYWLQSGDFRRQADTVKGNTDMAPYISLTDLRSASIALPPLDAQHAIAEVLGSLDDKITTNDRLVSTTDDLADTLLLSAAGDEVRRLDEVASLTMGSSPPGASYNETGVGVPFYQGVRDFGVRSPSRRVWTTAPVRLAQSDDTLLSVRAPVGRANLATEECCIGRGLAAIQSLEGCPFTLYYALRVTAAWAPFEAEGTVFGSINKSQLAAVEIPWVPDTQRGTTEEKLAALGRYSHSLLVENKKLKSLRDTLLPALMSGRLSVKDAENTVSEVV